MLNPRVVSCVVTLSLAVVLFACGDEAQTEGFRIETPASEEAVFPSPVGIVRGVAPGATALEIEVTAPDGTKTAFDAQPGTTFLVLADVEGALAAGRISEDYDVADWVSDAQDAFARDATCEAFGERGVLARVPLDARLGAQHVVGDILRLAAVADVVSATPWKAEDFQMRVEVLPKQRYRPWTGGGETETPPRLAQRPYPWDGTAEEFDTFKRAEVARWIAAAEAGEKYVPSDPRFRIVPGEGQDRAGVENFRVLEEPQGFRFDGRMVANVRISGDYNSGRPVVLYDVKPEFQDAFSDWTEANVGLPLAIVLRDICRSAPQIQARLRDNVQITLGAGSHAEQKEEALQLATTLGYEARLVAAVGCARVELSAEGRFEVLTSLDPGGATTLRIRLLDEDRTPLGDGLRRLGHRDDRSGDLAAAVEGIIAQLKMARIDDDRAADLHAEMGLGGFEPLSAVLRSSTEVSSRVEACRLLARMEGAATKRANAMVDALGDPDRTVRQGLLEGLSRCLWTAPDETAAVLESRIADIADGVRDLEAVHPVTLLLHEAGWDWGARFLLALLRAEDPESVRMGLAVATHFQAEMLDTVKERLVPAMREAMGTPAVRVDAARALWVLTEDASDVVPVLREVLRSENPAVSLDPGAAMAALALIGPDAAESVPDLLPFLEHELEEIRFGAAIALMRMGAATDAARSILDSVAADEDHPLHQVALWAMQGD